MKIIGDIHIDTPLGAVKCDLIRKSEYEQWIGDNPDSVIVVMEEMLLIASQTLPGP